MLILLQLSVRHYAVHIKSGEVIVACVLPFHCFQALHVGEEEINMNFFDRK